MNFGKSKNRFRRKSTNFTGIEKWRSLVRNKSRIENNFFDDNSDSDALDTADITNWREMFFGKKHGSQDINDQDNDVFLSEKQTFILATLVPDELILMEKFDNRSAKRYVGVVLMADVSGYTALSERYNSYGKSGTYRLTATLNTYLGSLIEIIYDHGGDVVKFAGDAFLAHWKTDKSSYLGHTVHAVIACALLIQHCYSSYETDVKINLKVKLAISAGNLIFSPIGKGIDMNYVIYGLPVLEAKMAESRCASGEVKVSPSAWGHCYSRNYDYIVHEDGHITVKCILYDPRENDVSKPFAGIATLIKPIRIPFTTIENLPDSLWENGDSLAGSKEAESLSIRKTMLTVKSRKIGPAIRKFMIRPVLTQVDAHQQLEYLTEMRQVTILFLTLKPKTCPFTQLLTIVNNSYEIICEIVYKSMGCVNKIILFDKDIMVLVVFGLRGFKHESDAQAALKCAYGIRKTVTDLDGVQSLSIGVTTGQVYSGVVGHPLRREFTVIGAIVNKAARLMCYFPNKITCDKATFINSKMSSNSFSLQPRVELKGIADPGEIFEYTEEIRARRIYDIEMIPPLLNRVDELEIFENWLFGKSKREFDALLLIGESRIGKTRTLEWMNREAHNKGMKTCTINITSIHSATPYLAVSQIVDQMLNLKEPLEEFEKESKIVKVLKYYSDDLCYLNTVLKVRFAFNESMNAVDENTKIERGKKVLLKLLNNLNEIHVIFLDNLQNLDATSWDMISVMLTSEKVFSVFTIIKSKFGALHSWMQNVFSNDRIKKVFLKPLHSMWIAPLACQILDVKSVSNDLCNALRTMWKGIPGLAESFLIHLFSSGALDLQKIDDTELETIKKEDFQFPEDKYLHPVAIDESQQETLNENIEQNATKEIPVCVVTKKAELDTDINEQNLDAMIMVQLDCLTPYQQMLLKIASVIGLVFTRELLENIMYECTPGTTARAVKRLFVLKILTCANTISKAQLRKRNTTISINSTDSQSNLECGCRFMYDPEENGNLPKYAFCRLMKFRHKNTRNTCYELLPANQKKEFHMRIIMFLESNRFKCQECGGKLVVVPTAGVYGEEYAKNEEVEEFTLDYINDDMSFSVESGSDMLTLGKNLRKFTTEIQSNLDKNTMRRLSVKQYNSEPSMSLMADNMNSDMSASGSKSDDTLVNYERRIPRRVTIFYQSSIFKKDFVAASTEKIFNKFRPLIEADYKDWKNFGIIDSVISNNFERYKDHALDIKLDLDLSKTDIAHCHCTELSLNIYEQLIFHATQAELKVKALEFLITYAYINVQNADPDDTLPKLEEAEEYCYDKQIQEVLTTIERRRYLARIYSLRAATNLADNNIHMAKINIECALRLYDKSNNKVSEILRLRSKYRNTENLMKADWVYSLNVATMIYTTIDDDKTARSYTNKAIKLIQKYDCEIVDICDTITNAIQIELSRGTADPTLELERIAAAALKKKNTPIKLEELWAIGKLLTTKFHAHLCRPNLGGSICLAYKSTVISRFLKADVITLEIVPQLFYVLLARQHIPQVLELLTDISAMSKETPDPEADTWYYALCMDLILDGGIQLESVYEINRYGEHILTHSKTNNSGARRLFVGLWTYWLRADMDHWARRFEHEALKWKNNVEEDGNFTSLISGLRLAEGMLESLARKVDDLKKVVDLMELRSLADRELVRLEGDAKLFRTIYPRWLLHRASSYRLSGRHTLADAEFNKAKEEARKIKNILEEQLAIASMKLSKKWLKNAETGIYPDWASTEDTIKEAWHDLLYRTTITREI